MTREKIFLVFIILILVSKCTIKNPVTEEFLSPFLSNLVAPDTLYLKTDIGYPISVKVSDPQGWEDIKTVKYSIFSKEGSVLLLADTLNDDGKGGDIIPRDGIFYDVMTTDFAGNKSGDYRIEVVAEDYDSNTSNTLFDTLAVVDNEKNFPPTLYDPVFPDTLTEESVEDVFLSIRADDPQGLGDIDTVFLQIYPAFSPVPLFSSTLIDNGNPPDIEAGDGIFSFWRNLFYDLRISGDYFIRFQAVDKSGLKSPAVVVQFTVIRPNDPPVISEIDAREVVSLSEGHFTISIKVDDFQGIEDIKKVYFNSTKPDGTPAEANPFRMYDDGEEKHGDETAGDGWYSLEVEITNQNEPGTYKFEFFAEDQSGAVSQSVIHNISVIIG